MPQAPLVQFTLYSRSWCHLCEDMLAALKAFPAASGHAIEVIDVDSDPQLVDLYDELVPVLTASRPGQAAQRLCHYHFDPASVSAFLSAPG